MEGPLWNYALTYFTPSITGKPLLSRIQKCDAAGRCQQPTRFTWEPGSFELDVRDSGVNDAINQTFDYGDLHLVQGMENVSRSIQAFDMDGDGRDDLVYRTFIFPTTSMAVANQPGNDASWSYRLSNGTSNT